MNCNAPRQLWDMRVMFDYYHLGYEKSKSTWKYNSIFKGIIIVSLFLAIGLISWLSYRMMIWTDISDLFWDAPAPFMVANVPFPKVLDSIDDIPDTLPPSCATPIPFHRNAYQVLFNDITPFNTFVDMVNSYEQTECRYGWRKMLATIGQFNTSYQFIQDKGRGIVFSVGDKSARFLLVSLRMLQYLNTSLPVEVFYNGDSDLSAPYRKLLEEFSFVTLRDFSTIFRPNRRVAGWQWKPWALAFASFDEPILLDADSFFFQDPIVLFNHSAYRTTGAMFYLDRTWSTPRAGLQEFIDSILPSHSPQLSINRMYNGQGRHQIESGVIVVNRRQHLTALLVTCLLNYGDLAKEMTYWSFYGEKEQFWLAWEMVKHPYQYDPHLPGTIGHRDEKGVCGKMIHMDESGDELLWMNGGVDSDKTERNPKNMVMTHWARQGVVYQGRGKIFCQEGIPFPLSSTDHTIVHKMTRLNTQAKATVKQLGR